jgi:hypothetical protein
MLNSYLQFKFNNQSNFETNFVKLIKTDSTWYQTNNRKKISTDEASSILYKLNIKINKFKDKVANRITTINENTVVFSVNRVPVNIVDMYIKPLVEYTDVNVLNELSYKLLNWKEFLFNDAYKYNDVDKGYNKGSIFNVIITSFISNPLFIPNYIKLIATSNKYRFSTDSNLVKKYVIPSVSNDSSDYTSVKYEDILNNLHLDLNVIDLVNVDVKYSTGFLLYIAYCIMHDIPISFDHIYLTDEELNNLFITKNDYIYIREINIKLTTLILNKLYSKYKTYEEFEASGFQEMLNEFEERLISKIDGKQRISMMLTNPLVMTVGLLTKDIEYTLYSRFFNE